MDIQNFLKPDKDPTKKDDKCVNDSDTERENESQSEIENIPLPSDKPLIADIYSNCLPKKKRAPERICLSLRLV